MRDSLGSDYGKALVKRMETFNQMLEERKEGTIDPNIAWRFQADTASQIEYLISIVDINGNYICSDDHYAKLKVKFRHKISAPTPETV